jgi:tetratricopeptide (TPR) repeat protein
MHRRTLVLALLFAVLALGGAGVAQAAPEDVPATPTLADLAALEKARTKRPNRVYLRDELGLGYYRYARAAFDRGEFSVYEDYLARATTEWLESLKLEPESAVPHIYMGIVSAYQGRIDDALDSFQNARALAPANGVSYTNLAETMIYAGRDAREVESWLSRGERMGASPAIVELNYCLLRWRDGDVEAASKKFQRALRFDRNVVRQWNEAPVSKPILSFEDLAGYCCGSPACGPYLANACKTAKQDVAERVAPEETKLRELRIEMERRRELERIYRQRRDLDIRVQKAEAEKAAPAEQPAPEAPATKEQSQ